MDSSGKETKSKVTRESLERDLMSVIKSFKGKKAQKLAKFQKSLAL